MTQTNTLPTKFTFSAPQGDFTIRTTLIDGEPWFVVADVLRSLGIRTDSFKPRNMLLDEEWQVVSKTRHLLPHLLTLFVGNEYSLRLVSESGLYKIAMRSDKLEARTFQHWVTAEVLPTIRKTGSYSHHLQRFGASDRHSTPRSDMGVPGPGGAMTTRS